MSNALTIRAARVGDQDAILALLREFAEFERLTQNFRLTHEIILRDFIGADRRVQCDVADWDGATAGVMVWFCTYSTFQAARVLFLEDLFVRPQFRTRGIGTAFLERLAHHAAAEGAARIEWSVLDWNKVAIDFYKSLNAQQVPGWQTYRLAGDALQRLRA